MRRLYRCTVHCTVLLFSLWLLLNILLSSAQKTTLSLPNPSWFRFGSKYQDINTDYYLTITFSYSCTGIPLYLLQVSRRRKCVINHGKSNFTPHENKTQTMNDPLFFFIFLILHNSSVEIPIVVWNDYQDSMI